VDYTECPTTVGDCSDKDIGSMVAHVDTKSFFGELDDGLG
jgi:hypothetical protein